MQTQTAALRQGTSVHLEHCHSGHLVDGGATADFPGDQPPTQKQLDALDLSTHRAGNELVTKAGVGPEAGNDPIVVQQDAICAQLTGSPTRA